MARHNVDIWAALTFSAAIAIIVLLLFLTGCAQPYTTESKAAGATPYCVWYCVVSTTIIEKNVGDGFMPTVGTNLTGGTRSETDTDTRTRTRTTGDRYPAKLCPRVRSRAGPEAPCQVACARLRWTRHRA